MYNSQSALESSCLRYSIAFISISFHCLPVKLSREPDVQIYELYGTLNEKIIRNFEHNIREILLVTVCYITLQVTGSKTTTSLCKAEDERMGVKKNKSFAGLLNVWWRKNDDVESGKEKNDGTHKVSNLLTLAEEGMQNL